MREVLQRVNSYCCRVMRRDVQKAPDDHLKETSRWFFSAANHDRKTLVYFLASRLYSVFLESRIVDLALTAIPPCCE